MRPSTAHGTNNLAINNQQHPQQQAKGSRLYSNYNNNKNNNKFSSSAENMNGSRPCSSTIACASY